MAEIPPVGAAGRLVAVVVTHNRPEHLRLTLQALLASDPDELDAVLVVDNASRPDTAAVLARFGDPRLSVLALPENRGGAGGFEAGLRHAMAHLAPDWLLVMDDDARPEPGALSAFRAMDTSGWDALAGAVRRPDGGLADMNRPTLNPFRHPRILLRALLGQGREAFHLSEPDFARPGARAVDGASFVGLFLSRRVIEHMGFPDGRLFLYADDAIYTQAMTRAGLRLAFVPDLRFVHDSHTIDPKDRRIRPLWKVYYYHRNLIELYRQATGRMFVPVMLLYLPRWVLRVRHHAGERRHFLRLFRHAVGDGLRRRLHVPHPQIVAMAEADTAMPRSPVSSAPAARDDAGATAEDRASSEPGRRP